MSGSWWGFLVLYLVWGDDDDELGAGSLGDLDGGKRRSGMGARRGIGKELSSYQIFRAVLDFLSQSSLERIYLFLYSLS